MTPEQEAWLKANCDRDGVLTPEDVVTAAEPEDSPLHELFTWNNEVAGHKHRLDEARALIRTIKIKIVTTTREIRLPAYIRDPEVPAHQQGYIRTALVRTREESIDAALQNEVDRVEAALVRGRKIAKGLEREADFERRILALMAPEYPDEPRADEEKPPAAMAG